MVLSEGEIIESLEIKDYKIVQNDNLYRFTSDAVMLSRFAKCKNGVTVADLCSGSGIVGLHYYCLNDDKVKSVTFFEIQKSLADMNSKSVKLNGLSDKMQVVNTPIQQIRESYFNGFNLVLCNPPYKKQHSGIVSDRREIAICKHEITVNLEEIVSVASRLLKRGGKFCICHKCERLNELFLLLDKYDLHPSRLKFVAGQPTKKPYLVLLESTKTSSPQLVVESLLVNDSKSFNGE
ncbi:MAG: tRNA1(Val) (adenine(37)-N6)-methyltransferase [Christensenellaceae bacterium]